MVHQPFTQFWEANQEALQAAGIDKETAEARYSVVTASAVAPNPPLILQMVKQSAISAQPTVEVLTAKLNEANGKIAELTEAASSNEEKLSHFVEILDDIKVQVLNLKAKGEADAATIADQDAAIKATKVALAAAQAEIERLTAKSLTDEATIADLSSKVTQTPK